MSTSMPAPVILAVAPNGAYKSQADHPALPITATEIASATAACVEAGAAMVHLHVRDRAGQHCLEVLAYREAMAAIRREVGPELLIQVTTEAAGRYRPEQQMALVRALEPEAVSLSVRELVSTEDD
ncbi:MAG: 3-keto-5-aminohexanoate cleavage protein, partial [Myxococcota bacterium]